MRLAASRPAVRPADEVRIRVRGSYEPDTIVAEAGRPLRLTFHRDTRATCSEQVIFPALGKSATLPPHEDVTVDLPLLEPGEYEFTCELGMLRGRVIVGGDGKAETSHGGQIGGLPGWGIRTRPDGKGPRPQEDPGTAMDHLPSVELRAPGPWVAAAARPLFARIWSVLLAAWAALTGILPHVLHHVGPLAGAALLAGAGGTALFAGIALVVSIPFLLRIYRRFRTWIAPAIALVLMAAAFSISSFVIGPLISGEGDGAPQPGIGEDAGHESHHSG